VHHRRRIAVAPARVGAERHHGPAHGIVDCSLTEGGRGLRLTDMPKNSSRPNMTAARKSSAAALLTVLFRGEI